MRKVIVILLLSFLFNSIFSNEFEQRIKGKFWLAGYYNVILQEKNRDIFLEHVPRFREKPREFVDIFYDYSCPINSKNHRKATRWEYSSLGEIFRNRRKTNSQVFYA